MWTKVVIEGQVLSLKTFLFARDSYENVLFSSKCSHFSLVYMQFVACSQPQQSRSLTRQERFLKEKSLFAGKVLPTHLFPNNKLYSFSVPEKAIGGLYWNTKAAMADGWWLMADAKVPLIYLNPLVHHLALLRACTSRPLCNPSITIVPFKRDTGAIGAGATAVRQWDNELRWAPCTFLALKF